MLVLANLAAEIESVHAGQHDVEQKQRRHRQRGLGNDRRSGEKRGDVEASGAQIVFDEVRHVGIVFDDVDQNGIARFGYRFQKIHGLKEASRGVDELRLVKSFALRLLTVEGRCCGNVAAV